MKIGERILLIFVAFVTVALVTVFAVCLWSPRVMLYVGEFLDSSVAVRVAITAVLALIALLSIRTTWVGLSKRADKIAALAAATAEGGIYINLETINELAARATRKVPAVREIRVKTAIVDQGAALAIKVSLDKDTVIPETSAQIQQNVKSDIETLCGIAVHKVSVQVDNSLVSKQN